MATLYINRSESRCGNCGKGASPYELKHIMTPGLGNPEAGCRATFTAVASDYFGMDADIEKMRPDLPVVDWGY